MRRPWWARIAGVLVRVGMVLAVGSGVSLTTAASDTVTVKIGLAALNQGSNAVLGQDMERGAKRAIDALNAKGMSAGTQKLRFVLVAEDDQGSATSSLGAVQRLVDAKVHGVVGHFVADASAEAFTVYAKAGVPLLVASAAGAMPTVKGEKTIFRLIASPPRLHQVIGREAANRWRPLRIVVLTDATPQGNTAAADMVEGLVRTGKTMGVMRRLDTHPRASNFNAAMGEVKKLNPDLVMIGADAVAAGPMVARLKADRVRPRVVVADAACTDKLFDLSLGAAGDLEVVCGAVPQAHAAHAEDAVNVLAAAMVAADSIEPAKFLPMLASISHQGLTGHIGFDERGELKDAAVAIIGFKEGQRRVLEVVR